MIKINLAKKTVVLILLTFILLGGLSIASFHISKLAAEKLVGHSLNYFPLTESKISVEPFERHQLVWLFKFSHPGSFDEEFYIYTTLWGKVVLTNPKDLEERVKRNRSCMK